jgi:hypothetical protein
MKRRYLIYHKSHWEQEELSKQDSQKLATLVCFVGDIVLKNKNVDIKFSARDAFVSSLYYMHI